MRHLFGFLLFLSLTGLSLAEVVKAPDGSTLTVPDNYGKSSAGTRDSEWYTTFWDRKSDWHISFSVKDFKGKASSEMAWLKKVAKKSGGYKKHKVSGAISAIRYTTDSGEVKVVAVGSKKRYSLTVRGPKGASKSEVEAEAKKVSATLKVGK